MGTRAGVVATSSAVSHTIAALALPPHISSDGMSCPHTAGRPGWPKMRQAFDASSWMQRTPAGLPPATLREGRG